MPVSDRKAEYFKTLERCFTDYARFFMVCVDHVGSKQMQDIRMALRGKAEVLMGKNTMIRKAIKGFMAENEAMASLELLLPIMKGNLGFVFTNGDLNEVRDIIGQYKVPASAKAGVMSTVDVTVDAGPTGLDPAQTSFFQALNVPTKINKGSIEILNPVQVVSKGQRVGSSEAALLQKLNLKPFTYGFEILYVFEGGLFPVDVLDITDADLLASWGAAMAVVASVSLECGLLNAASFPHIFMNAFKDVLAIAVETDYDFPQAEKVKAILNMDPEELAKLAAASAAATPAAGGAAAAKEPEPEPEEEEEEEEDIGFDLFD